MMKVTIGLFARDEERDLPALMEDLSRQDIFRDASFDARILILANGCTDATVAVARDMLARLPAHFSGRVRVMDLEQGGKSRTAHRFIHDFSGPEDDILGFMDADIRLPDPQALRKMAQMLRDRSELLVLTSRPVKDTVLSGTARGMVPRLIAMGGDGLTDWRKSICGQLFMTRAAAVRRIGIPTGLPVEDGFFRAMLLTGLLSRPEDLSVIDGHPEVFHVYRSIDTLPALVRHQARIVIGSAINAAIYRKIRAQTQSEAEAHDLLMQAAADEGWLQTVIAQELPRRPYGYVPFEMIGKRWRRYAAGRRFGARPTLGLVLGTGLDIVVWFVASYKMHKGAGAGYW